MTENDLTLTTNCIKALAAEPNADELIRHLLTSLFFSQVKSQRSATTPLSQQNKIRRPARYSSNPNALFWIFSKKEIETMPTKYRKMFIVAEQRVFYRIKPTGVYEARFKRKAEGINIEVSALTLDEVKRRFIQALHDCANGVKSSKRKKTLENTLFSDYLYEWLSEKKRSTKPGTYAEYERQIQKDILPHFENVYLAQIDRSMLQRFLNIYVDSNRLRTAQKLQLILRCACDLVSSDFNIRSPMEKVSLPFYKPKKGKAFTKAEEAQLIDHCIKNINLASSSALLVLLFFGLRQSELASLRVIDNQWLICTTSKSRLGHDEEERKIPFMPVMQKYLPYIDFEKARTTNPDAIKSTGRRLFSTHRVHDLRYTFITRCKECGVNPELVMLWDGHEMDDSVKTSKVDRGYTDYSDEYQLKEAQKVNYNIPTTTI